MWYSFLTPICLSLQVEEHLLLHEAGVCPVGARRHGSEGERAGSVGGGDGDGEDLQCPVPRPAAG